MYIKQIDIRKYRHIENISIGPFLTPGDASACIVFAGPNGGGKSSVLELISLALANSWSLTYQLNRSAPDSSFEVCIGLLPSEIELIKSKFGHDDENQDVINYLDQYKSYFRSFKFEGGEYDKRSSLHNKIHNCVTSALKGDHHRPLGFHLGSERSFKKSRFEYQKKLFNYRQYMEKQHTWGFAFRSESEQFEDMFDFLITWQHNYLQQLGSYYHLKNSGLTEEYGPPPEDRYGRVLSEVFPDYAFVHQPESAPSDLFVRIPSGDTIPFSDLSSGEKQVFFTLCFFERHDVEEAVILIDEPELHLHPSLARLLLRTMLRLKPRNQIWLATQSAEVIDEAGRDAVRFIRRNDDTRRAEVISATEEEPALACLRDFFGYSGYIGLARAMIFTEGRNASADRKMFSRIFPQHSREIKFIPATGCSEIERLNRAILSILEANIGWCQFYLVRDRDYMTPDVVQAILDRAGNRVHILELHEIENYLLQPGLIARVLDELFDQRLTQDEVQVSLRDVACEIAGDVLRDMVSFRLNYKFRPEDFSVAKLFKGELRYDLQESNWDTDKLEALQEALAQRADEVVADLTSKVNNHSFESLFNDCRQEIEEALASDGWRSVFPGKELLASFCRKHQLGKSPVLENAIIKEMAAHPASVPDELRQVIEEVVGLDRTAIGSN